MGSDDLSHSGNPCIDSSFAQRGFVVYCNIETFFVMRDINKILLLLLDEKDVLSSCYGLALA